MYVAPQVSFFLILRPSQNSQSPSDDNLYLSIATKMWDHIKNFMITSSDLICYQIEPDAIMHFLDFIEEVIRKHMLVLSAKL